MPCSIRSRGRINHVKVSRLIFVNISLPLAFGRGWEKEDRDKQHAPLKRFSSLRTVLHGGLFAVVARHGLADWWFRRSCRLQRGRGLHDTADQMGWDEGACADASSRRALGHGRQSCRRFVSVALRYPRPVRPSSGKARRRGPPEREPAACAVRPPSLASIRRATRSRCLASVASIPNSEHTASTTRLSSSMSVVSKMPLTIFPDLLIVRSPSSADSRWACPYHEANPLTALGRLHKRS